MVRIAPAARDFGGGAPQADDIAMLTIARTIIPARTIA